MSNIYIGRVSGTHGIKGEIRIKSDFEYKSLVFKVNNYIVIDKKKYKIRSYRKHKEFDMVCLDDYDNINQVLFLIKKNVYIDRDDYNFSDVILDEDLLCYDVVCNDLVGRVLDIYYVSKLNKIIEVKLDRIYKIPFNSPYIKKEKKNKKIYVELIEGM